MYESIREEVRRRIRTEVYKPGQVIPSAAALADEFDVSVITVKRALSDLRAAGQLRATPGKGTFVKEQRRFIRELDVWMSSFQNAKVQGLELSLQVISVTKEPLKDPVFALLGSHDVALYCIRKVIFADDLPIMYDTTYLPLSLGDHVIDACSERMVYDVLRDQGLKLDKVRLLIDAAPASLTAQKIFSVPNGYPSLRRFYHHSTDQLDVFIAGVVESPFDRVVCAINLPDGADLNDTIR
nr:GntR family transcriptional regulator [Mesorhizobium camelthorni]